MFLFTEFSAPHVVLGITTKGNIDALRLCLTSVLTSSVVPSKIIIRSEGELPLVDFYLQRIADMARLQGVEFAVHRCASEGIRSARNWLLGQAGAHTLWLLDDDVIVNHRCLEQLVKVQALLETYSDVPNDPRGSWAWIAASKVDVVNIRQYPDYSTKRRPIPSAFMEPVSQNHFYEPLPRNPSYCALPRVDTGNTLLNTGLIEKKGINFSSVPLSANAGGEDTVFSYVARKSKLSGWMAMEAESYHLEKAQVRFDERVNRAAVVELSTKLYDLAQNNCGNSNLPAAAQPAEDSSQSV